MTVFRTTDILVFNEDHSASAFENNFGPIEDEYQLQRRYRDLELHAAGSPSADIIYVTNLRTGQEESGYWWRLRVKDAEVPYDPSQAGDQEDDI